MSLTQQEIQQILELLDHSTYDELYLAMGDLKLHIRRGAGSGLSLEIGVADPSPTSPPEPETIPEAPPAGEVHPDGLVAVEAPMVGTAYSRPSPGAPPFVQVGDLVDPGDTVCMIEVMKLFNSVPAGTRGRVVEIRFEDASSVEYGQVLVLIDPGATE